MQTEASSDSLSSTYSIQTFKVSTLGGILLLLFTVMTTNNAKATSPDSSSSKLANHGFYVIPYPQEITFTGNNFALDSVIPIVIDSKVSESDRFSAQQLADALQEQWNIETTIQSTNADNAIRLTRTRAPKKVGNEGYHLSVDDDQITIEANGEAGLFYGVQTLTQLIKKEKDTPFIPGLDITDWPGIGKRAAHYDTKHHQDKAEYVKKFIRELAHYKINILVWEWEDKFLYPSHPEIGAPGAFTMKEMQAFTRYAQQYHVQIVPLVQGLGHVSFILKWPQFAHLREISASNWEFCPLKDGTYDLLFDLWEDAIKATPGSEYIHIGSDETYELGKGPECREKAKEIGKSGLYHLFVKRASEHLRKLGRKVMVWERPMGWKMSDSPIKGGATPAEHIVLTESYHYETQDFKYAKKAKKLGYSIFVYDPNPGIEPIFLPLFYREKKDHKISGSLENSYNLLTSAAQSGVFDGMIRTSWDDAGLHNQFWMMQFLDAAEYSWNGSTPSLDEFKQTFFNNYYGTDAKNMNELFSLLNEGSYYYWDTLERKVWHFGPIGKTHLPDLPRGDYVEFDPYWNQKNKKMIKRSEYEQNQMKRAIQICNENINASTKHSYDLKLFKSMAELVKHTSNVYLDLSNIEKALQEAQDQRFINHEKAYEALKKAVNIGRDNLEERKEVFDNIVELWKKTRLSKGMSTEDKKYFWRQDRARHFANRRPDMSYFIYDEHLLGLAEYLDKLENYTEWYHKTFLE